MGAATSPASDSGSRDEVKGEAPEGFMDVRGGGDMPGCIEVAQESAEEGERRRVTVLGKAKEGPLSVVPLLLVVFGEEGGESSDRRGSPEGER